MPTVINEVGVTAVRVIGCGHVIYLSDDHVAMRQRDHKPFYCTVCGDTNYYPGKSPEERLRGQLAATQDMLDTVRDNAKRAEYRRRAEKAAKTRIKNRIAKGVCLR